MAVLPGFGYAAVDTSPATANADPPGNAYAAVNFVPRDTGPVWKFGADVHLTRTAQAGFARVGFWSRNFIAGSLPALETPMTIVEVLQSTATIVSVFMRDGAGNGLPGIAASITTKLKKSNQSSFTVIAPTVSDRGLGWYDFLFTTSHLDTLGYAPLDITAPNALSRDDIVLSVVTLNKFTDSVRAGLTALPNAAAGANGGLPLVGNQIPNATVATPDGLPTTEMISNIGVTTAALNIIAASRVITTGTESGVLANTDALDNVFHTFTAVGGVIDVYYQFDVSAILNAAGTSAQWKGYFNTTPFVMNVYAWNWTSSSWDQIGTIAASGDTVVFGAEFTLTNSHTSAGLVRIRFATTGSTGGVLATDRLLLGYVVTASTPSAVAVAVVDQTLTGHTTAGTVGGALAGIPTAAAIASAVLDAARSGHVTLGTVGEGIALAAALLQGNFYMDNVTNTANGQTNARLRVFHTGTAAGAATPGGVGQGEFATFVVTTSYSGPNKIIDHRVVQQ